MGCDWHELTTGRGAEGLERTPVQPGDVLIGDRGYCRAKGIRAVAAGGAYVLVRMRWNHHKLVDESGEKQSALSLSKDLRVGQVGDWPVLMFDDDGGKIEARVVALKLPLPIAEKARKRLRRTASKQQRNLDPRSLEAAGRIMLLTTLRPEVLDAVSVLELYRHRWQIETAFKRHKQLLQLGNLPHKNAEAAQSWILSKLVVALLLEKLYRQAVSISPWGYQLHSPRSRSP